MPDRVLAIAVDAPNQALLQQWLAAGLLPNLQRMRDQGLAVGIESHKAHSNEYSWIPVLTGRSRRRWDHWLDRWSADTYAFDEASLFDWIQAPLFYALGEQCRVIAFDLAAPVVPGVNGIQVSGFAAEINESFPQSQPPGLFAQLEDLFGPDPKLPAAPQRIVNGVSGREGISWTVPSCYRADQMRDFGQALVKSVERRTAACLHLMASEAWDLFISGFTEIHTAGHLLWHLSQPHPLSVLREGAADPLLAVYQAVDRSLGQLRDAAPPGVSLVFFTLDATVPDSLENARVVFLPEFLYRWSFPGKAALAAGDAGSAPPAPRLDYTEHWKHEIWKLRTAGGEAELESPSAQQARGDPLGWCPANWYAPLWPRMKAFALPSVADGYVRINVAGREAGGMVDPSDFGQVCTELAATISALVNARTGQSIVREVVRVREDPFDPDRQKPPADLLVVFREDGPVDVVDCALGRIGPLPYFRSSSHQSHGALIHNLLVVAGAGAERRHALPGAGRLEDIPATILELLGIAPPPGFEGTSRIT